MSREDNLIYLGCFFALGVALQGVYSSTIALIYACLTATCLLATARLFAGKQGYLKRCIGRVTCACVALLIGTLVMNSCVSRRQNSAELTSHTSGEILEVQGIILDMPEADAEGRWKTVLILKTVMGKPSPKARRILLTGEIDEECSLNFRTGHIVEASGRFYLPRAPMNPGEPDMRRHMAYRKLDGTLYVKNMDDICIMGWKKPSLIQCVAISFSETVVKVNDATLSPNHASMLTGMLLGKTPFHMKSALEVTGTSHLFAASGLHVGYVALAATALLTPLPLPAPAKSAIVLMFIWIYAVACGLRSSVVRAVLMFSLAAASKVMGRKVSSRCSLILAGFIMLIVNPATVFDVGAQLSFLTVLAIMHLYPKVQLPVRPCLSVLWETFAVSVSAQLGAAPLVAWYFRMFSPISIVANVPCVILAGLAVLIGLCAALAGSVSLPAALVLNSANSLILLGLERTIRFFAKVPFGSFAVPRPPLWFIISYYLVVILAGTARRVRRVLFARRNCILLIILALCVGAVAYGVVKRPEVEIVFLSVGQGDAIFIRSVHGKLFLIDGGGLPGNIGDPGKDTLLPFLERRGINYIDAVVATHPHYDHIKGLFAIMDSCSVGVLLKPAIPKWLTSDLDYALVSLAEKKGVQVVELAQDGWIDSGDGVKMLVLSPPVDLKQSSVGYVADELNDLSLVMKMTFMDFTLLLTGDAGEVPLDVILKRGGDLEAGVLKVPHHGAKDALGFDIVNSIRPRVSVISVGPNAFSHPSPVTLDVLEEIDSIVFRTDLDGAVIVTSDGKRIRAHSIRSRRHYELKT